MHDSRSASARVRSDNGNRGSSTRIEEFLLEQIQNFTFLTYNYAEANRHPGFSYSYLSVLRMISERIGIMTH